MFLTRYMAIGLAAFAMAAISHAQTDSSNLDSLAQRLIAARAQVEELQSELDIDREEHKGKMEYLSAQVTELEANQEREELRIRQLEQELDKLRTDAEAAGADADSLQPVVRTIVENLRETVAQSLPFKQSDRLAELDEVITEMDAGVTTPQRAINRLWAFVEDELRISRENAIYSQTIQLSGQPVLADVAKLGSVALYFRTRDDRYGLAMPTGGNWVWQVAENADDQKQIEGLFDALRKQIRQGFFNLPNALPTLATAQS